MKRIGLVTAGGDAPGMNAAIRAVVRSAVFHKLEVLGIMRGYSGLIDCQFRPLGPRSVSGIINLGGTIIRTARCEEIKTEQGVNKAVETIKSQKIDGLIVIGGDGTFRGAQEIYVSSGVPVIGIPATIDNDVAGTDFTIGFDTAVNTAVFAIDRIRDTATSLERIFVVEVMGRKRGFLALAVGLADGAEFILIPEIPYDIGNICCKIELERKRGKTSEIIVMAEGAGDSSKIVNCIQKQTGIDARLTILGHMQRGGSPTAESRILASRFGSRSVELLLEGKKKDMVCIQNGKIQSVDLDFVCRERKEIDKSLYALAKILSA